MKTIIIKLIKYLLLPIGFLHALFNRNNNIVILMYHRINDSVSKELSVRRSDFIWQMNYLLRKGYKVISLDEAIRNEFIDSINQHICGCTYKKKKYIVLTFDDGYEDYYTTAFPILLHFGYPSLVFPVPGYIETGNVFRWDKDLGESRLMNWKEIKELSETDLVVFGSHSMTHPDFDKISLKQAEEELVLSRDILEEKLALRIRHFAYPRGIVDKKTLDIIKKLYQTGLSIYNGYEITGEISYSDLFQLKRIPVQRSDGRFLFGPRIKGWLVPEEWLKRLLGRS